MNENELVVYYRRERFVVSAMHCPDGLYRASVVETTGAEALSFWDTQMTGFETAHELLESYVGSIMDYVDEATE